MKSDLHQKYAIPETSMVKRLDENECKHKTSGDMKSPVHCVKCGYIPSITINPPHTGSGESGWESKFCSILAEFVSRKRLERRAEILDFIRKEIQLAVNKAEKRMIEKVKKARFEGYLKGREEGLNLFNKVKGIKITGV